MGSFFFAFYVVFVAGVYISKSRPQSLWCNALCCLSCSVYLYTMGGFAGVVACWAAAAGSLYQIYFLRRQTPKEEQGRVLLYKCIGSIVFALFGIIAVYESAADLLLVAAIIVSRYAEMLEDSKQLKLGYLIAEALWFYYAAMNEFLGMYVIHCIMISLGLSAMYLKPKIAPLFTREQAI